MKMRTITVLAVFILFATIFLTGCGGNKNTPGKQGEKIIVRMVGTLPAQHHFTKALEMYKEKVEKKSNGRIEVQIYPSQQLYNDKDLVNVLPNGAVEMAFLNPDMWAGLIPSEGILYLPTYYKSREQFYAVLDGEPGQMINKDFEKKGNTKILGNIEYGASGIISKKPITRMEDFKGLRTRSFGEYIATFLQAVGASPTTMSSGEMYQALQKGTLDAAMSGPGSFVDRKLYEVADYYLENDLMHSTPFLTGVNLDFWNKLPPDLQEVLKEAALEVQDWTRKYALESDQKYKETLKEKGVKFTKISDEEYSRWREKAAPALEAHYKDKVGAEKAQIILDDIKNMIKGSVN